MLNLSMVTDSTHSPKTDVIRSLLCRLHPTPAVCGLPPSRAMSFIQSYEGRSGFDRGYYAGPFGYLGADDADVSVALRSAVLTRGRGAAEEGGEEDDPSSTRVSIYAGAGIVPGSTPEGEWMETSQKLGVMSSLFPPSPVTLQSAQTPNVAWATAFVEELIRCGVTRFYVCPGSRSTPLTAAVARAARAHIGIVQGISVHDERGAAFRALGYARGTGGPAAVITSSGTAVANLYPAVVEAGMDGVPMLLITADRPYENRDTGANQAIDQVKVSGPWSGYVFQESALIMGRRIDACYFFRDLCFQTNWLVIVASYRIPSCLRRFHPHMCDGSEISSHQTMMSL